MLLKILHETKLSYTEPVAETVLEVRMAPPSDEDQTNLGYRLKITPSPPVTTYRDGFGNRVDLFNILSSFRELTIRATTIVRTHRRCVRERLGMAGWPDQERPSDIEAIEFLQASPLLQPGPSFETFLAGIPRPTGSLLEGVEQVIAAVQARLKYEKRVTTANTSIDEVLKLGRGVCQDFAHLFLAICRGLGLPARYVSGYVDGPGEMETHAWCQVWGGEEMGWIDVDPTRGLIVGDHHVVTAVGRDYSDVPPNRGVWKGLADETISVSVQVEPIDRMPPDWGDWAVPASWPAPIVTTNRRPHRNGPGLQQIGYRQQQSQQQQGRYTSRGHH